MGSTPTLDAQAASSGHDPTVTAAEAAFARLNPSLAFAWPNPYLPGIGPAERPRTGPAGPQGRRDLVRTLEDIDARGYRAWLEEANESPPTPVALRHAAVRHRAGHARVLAAERAMAARAAAEQALAARVHAEQVFDRLNPEFGVAADTTDPRGQAAVWDREAGLALGTRVAVAAARQRHGPERASPER